MSSAIVMFLDIATYAQMEPKEPDFTALWPGQLAASQIEECTLLVDEKKVNGALLPLGATKSAEFKAHIARLRIAIFCLPMNRGGLRSARGFVTVKIPFVW